MSAGIYQVKNAVNGKRYIGQSFNVTRRLRRHHFDLARNAHPYNAHLQSAWNKYGADAFVFEQLIQCAPDRAYLHQLEQRCIDVYQTRDPGHGYNKRVSSETNLGRTLSAAHKAGISAALKGIKKSPEHASKVGKARRARKLPASMETRAKLSLASRTAKATVAYEGGLTSFNQLGKLFAVSPKAIWRRAKRGVAIERAIELAVFAKKGSA